MAEGLDTLDPSGGIALFTDGSSWTTDGFGGWAWVAFGVAEGEAWDSGGAPRTTNNRMEMEAWIQGLDALYDALGACTILVYSDSQYVGFGATDRRRQRRKNKDLWVEIDRAIDRHQYVEFCHVRGHTGHEYNERVDQLATEARLSYREAATAKNP